jgi:hypothetical protein
MHPIRLRLPMLRNNIPGNETLNTRFAEGVRKPTFAKSYGRLSRTCERQWAPLRVTDSEGLRRKYGPRR